MNKHWDIFHKKAKYFWLLLWRKDIVIFLLFVGLATIFWWGRAMSSPRDMNIKICINYVGIPANALLSNDLAEEFTVTIRDDGKQLRQLSRHRQELTLDLSSSFHAPMGDVRITSDMIRPRLQDLLPGSTQIQHISPEEIVVDYQLEYSKRVAVRLSAVIEAADQYQMVGAAQLSPSEVDIYGSESILSGIDYIETDSVHLLGVRGEVAERLVLLPPSGVRVHPNSVGLTWRSEQFTEKTFRLPIEIEGKPSGEEVRLFPQVADVTFRVIVSEFGNVGVDDLRLYCRYPEEACNWLQLEVATTNPHVYNIRIVPDAVEYIIEKENK